MANIPKFPVHSFRQTQLGPQDAGYTTKRNRAIRLISRIALECTSSEAQLIIYEAMSACLPTLEERSVAARIAQALRNSDRLQLQFLRCQSGLLASAEDEEAA